MNLKTKVQQLHYCYGALGDAVWSLEEVFHSPTQRKQAALTEILKLCAIDGAVRGLWEGEGGDDPPSSTWWWSCKLPKPVTYQKPIICERIQLPPLTHKSVSTSGTVNKYTSVRTGVCVRRASVCGDDGWGNGVLSGRACINVCQFYTQPDRTVTHSNMGGSHPDEPSFISCPCSTAKNMWHVVFINSTSIWSSLPLTHPCTPLSFHSFTPKHTRTQRTPYKH